MSSKPPVSEGGPPIDIPTDNNRFSTQFERIGERALGEGQFGVTYKVKHKLDNREYAVKVMTLRGPKDPNAVDFHQAKKEVERLARFERNYIVGYKSAWIEQVPISESSLDSGILTEATTESQSTGDPDSQQSAPCQPVIEAINSSNELKSFNESLNQETILPLKESLDDNKRTFVYIQMELCLMTLDAWIERRDSLIMNSYISGAADGMEKIIKIIKEEWISNSRWVPETKDSLIQDTDKFHEYIEPNTTNRFLGGIVRGLWYLHGGKIAHGDLHTENVLIFISDEGEITPRLSDFGESKTVDSESIQKIRGERPRLAQKNERLSPRSHTCSDAEQCKDDMIELGEIIKELYCYPERNPDKFERRWPTHAGWIKDLREDFGEDLGEESHISIPTATMILRTGIQEGIFESNDQLREKEQLMLQEKLEKENSELYIRAEENERLNRQLNNAIMEQDKRERKLLMEKEDERMERDRREKELLMSNERLENELIELKKRLKEQTIRQEEREVAIHPRN